MNRRRCPVCLEAASDPWLRKDSFSVVRCRTCAMKYIQDPAVIPPSYYETDADKFYTSADKVRGDYSRHRYDREISAFTRFCPRGKALDVGCSTGGFLYQTRLRFGSNYELFGTDIAHSATTIAREHGVNIISSNFLSDEFPEREFQAITFWAVLEHLLSPAVFLQKAHRLLSPGGLVFVVVPNIRSLAVRLIGRRYRYIMPEHLNYFSIRTLTQLFEPNFRPAHLTTSHFNPLVIAQDALRRDAPAPSERAQLLNRTNAMKEMRTLKPLQSGYALAERMLARAGLADNILAVFQKRQP